MTQLQTIRLPGNRVLYVGPLTFHPGDGQGPDRRVLIGTGWRHDPTPLKHAVSLPVDVVPALVAALEAVHETSHETNNAA